MSEGTTLSVADGRVMRVLFTGSRTWNAFDLAVSILGGMTASYQCRIIVIHGDCTGVDAAVNRAAKFCELAFERFEAHWNDLDHPLAVIRTGRYGKPYNANAGPCRNQAMVDAGADVCIAIHRDLLKSKGTWDCAKRAMKKRIPTWHFRTEGVSPLRIRSLSRSKIEYEVNA